MPSRRKKGRDGVGRGWRQLSADGGDELAQRVKVLLVGVALVEGSHGTTAGEAAAVDGYALRLEQTLHLRHRRFDDGTRAEADHTLDHLGLEATDEGGHLAADSAEHHTAAQIERVDGFGNGGGDVSSLDAGGLGYDLRHLGRVAKLGEITYCCCHVLV